LLDQRESREVLQKKSSCRLSYEDPYTLLILAADVLYRGVDQHQMSSKECELWCELNFRVKPKMEEDNDGCSYR